MEQPALVSHSTQSWKKSLQKSGGEQFGGGSSKQAPVVALQWFTPSQ
jgi:hypothetical protein